MAKLSCRSARQSGTVSVLLECALFDINDRKHERRAVLYQSRRALSCSSQSPGNGKRMPARWRRRKCPFFPAPLRRCTSRNAGARQVFRVSSGGYASIRAASMPSSPRQPRSASLALGPILVKLSLDSGFASRGVGKLVHAFHTSTNVVEWPRVTPRG